MAYNIHKSSNKNPNMKERNEKAYLNGIYVAEIINNIDVSRTGRVQVFVAALTIDDSGKSGYFDAVWTSPFAGSTNPRSVGKEIENPDHAMSSYGWWGQVPDIGNMVLIAFGDGNTKFPFVISCLYPDMFANMVPGLPAGKNYQDPTKLLPTVEKNKRTQDVRHNDTFRPVQHTLSEAIVKQGLINDATRGAGSSGSRRESPSEVFGILTPGPRKSAITGSEKDFDIRLGGHQFVMDDNLDSRQIRIRSAEGNQVLLDDNEGVIYLINKSGRAWIEMNSLGDIHVFGEGSINMRAKQNFNIRADYNINLEAGKDINLKAAMDTLGSEYKGAGNGSGGSIHLDAEGEIKNIAGASIINRSIAGDVSTHASGSIKQEAANGDIELLSGNEFKSKSVGKYSIKAGGDVTMEGAQIVEKGEQVLMNSGGSSPAEPGVNDASLLENILPTEYEDYMNKQPEYDSEGDTLLPSDGKRIKYNMKSIVTNLITAEPFAGHTPADPENENQASIVPDESIADAMAPNSNGVLGPKGETPADSNSPAGYQPSTGYDDNNNPLYNEPSKNVTSNFTPAFNKKLEEKLIQLNTIRPRKPNNTTIIDNTLDLISLHFSNIETLHNIVNTYSKYPSNNKTTININKLKDLNTLQESLNSINNNININNTTIQNIQITINDLNNSIHALDYIKKPLISIKEAEEAIEYFKSLEIKYPNKYIIFEKYTKQLTELEKEYIKPTIELELCNKYIDEYNKLNILKSTYDIQININTTIEQLSEYKLTEYNPECHICMKQSSVIKKLELENKLTTLNNSIDLCILNLKMYIKRFNYLEHNLDHYKNTINQYTIEYTINNIKNKKIFKWIQDYNELKSNINYYTDSIKQHKQYELYKTTLNDLNSNIKIKVNELKLLQDDTNKQLNIDKKNLENDLNTLYYTINYAYTLYDSYLAIEYNNWNENIKAIENTLKFKEPVKDYNNIEDYKQLELWNTYYYKEELINYAKKHFKRKTILNKIKDIENEINELIIYKTNMITHFDSFSKNKIEHNILNTLQININHSIITFKRILENYDNFQKWIYDTHILPNIISTVNNIIKQSTINPFIINAFVENEGIQFSLNNTISINKASGFQRFVINIALRMAFLQIYNNKCFCLQLFIDEGWTSADANNRTLIPKVLNYLLTQFNSVILVSHIDEIKDITDISIKINKNKDYSQIQYS